MAKATPIAPGMGGKLASRKSKTGNPECSRAMSAWVRARHAGMSVAAEVFKVLGKCRAQARMLAGARNQANAGNELKAQALTARAARGLTMAERQAKAKELVVQRRAGIQAKAQASALPPRTADTMSEAIALSSPSGKMSKRARTAANERLRKALFGEKGMPMPGAKQPTIAEHNARLQSEAQKRKAIKQAIKARDARYERLGAEGMGQRASLGIKRKAEAQKLREQRRAGDRAAQAAPAPLAPGRGTSERQVMAGRLNRARKAFQARQARDNMRPADYSDRDSKAFRGVQAVRKRIEERRYQEAKAKGDEEHRKNSAVIAEHAKAGNPVRLPNSVKPVIAHPDRIKLSSSGELLYLEGKKWVSDGRGETAAAARLIGSKQAPAPGKATAAAAAQSPKVREVLGLFDEKGQNLRGGDVIRAALKNATPDDLATLRKHIDAQPPETRGRWNRWLGGEVAGELRARANAAAPATIGGEKPGEKFSLLQRKATSSSPTAQDMGKGRTPFMFDMKRGDLPGQTSLLDRVPILDTKTGEVVSRQKAKMAAAVRAVSKSTGKPVKDIGAAISHARQQMSAAASRGDSVGQHQWGEHLTALTLHSRGKKYSKMGGWNLPESGEKSRAAALVAKARAKGTVTERKPLAPAEQAEPLRRISEREMMKGRRAKTAQALKEFRGKLERFTDVAGKGQPGDTGYVPTSKLNFDPERFQFKQSAQGKHGVTDQFKETKKWNPELAGVISAWRDPADGKLYVVNGHHRADLAQRLNVDKVRVQLLNARDASEARAKGAIENIGEGRGTAYDAAKFLRESGITKASHLEDHGVSLSENTAKKGLALAGLHPSLWRKYEGGQLPEERAALIGGSGLNHAQQESLMKSVKKGTNNSTLRELIDNAHAAGTVKSQTRDLFGTSEEEVSLAHHRAKVQAHVRDAILADKRLYGLVSKSKAAQSLEEREAGRVDTGKAGEISQQSRALLEAFDTLKNRSGPAARAIDAATEELNAGKPSKEVLARARKTVFGELERVLKGGKEAFAA